MGATPHSDPKYKVYREPNVTAINDLDIFARVARTGNMSMAGREIGLSPAVVSKRISLLEDHLGARLFQRTTRQLTLTETGQGYYKRVVDILSLVDEAEDYVARRNTNPRGVLKVTLPTALARNFITPHMAEFHRQFPDIEIDAQVTDNFVDIIREGFDLAIRIGELEDSSLVARKLASEHRILCASPSYLEHAGTPTSLFDLEAHACLIAGAQDSWKLTGPDGPVDIRIKGHIRSNSAGFIRDALVNGLGIALRASWDVADDIANGDLVQILPDYTGSSKTAIHAVYPCREFLPTKVHTFIDFFAAVLERELKSEAKPVKAPLKVVSTSKTKRRSAG